MSRLAARALLALVFTVALTEWVAAAWAYRDRIEPSDWVTVADATASLEDEPLFVANRWLDPLARAHLPIANQRRNLAPASLRGASRFHVLGFGTTRWSRELQTDLEDLPVPRREAHRRLGPLTLTTYALSTPKLVHDFMDDTPRVQSERGPCRPRGPAFRCEEGRVRARFVEVDHRPRYCFSVDASDGVEISLRLPAVPEADRFIGHVGFSDYNGRLRSDGAAVVVLQRGKTRLGRWVVTDAQGWTPFGAEVEPSTEPLTLRIRSTVRGTWGRAGYQPGRPRPPCVELRAFAEEPSP